MAIVTTDNTHYGDIAAAIREKAGGTALYKPSEMAAAIRSIQAGGGAPAASVSLKDVNFYDYDGTLVASYTLAEAQALTALPDGPTHEGLTFQGWNWSLEDINALTRPMNVGAMYITDDGKTRLHIRIWDTARSLVPLYISQTVANGVTIDWGDGSATETLDGIGIVNTTHQYTAEGDYTITLDPADGCTLGLGAGYSSYCVMGSTNNNGRVYCNLLQAVNIGKNVTDGCVYAFYYCYSLTSITIPYGITTISSNMLNSCSSLESITIPDGARSIGSYALSSCYSLTSISIPNGMESIDSSYAFSNCYSLASVTVPDSVIGIGDRAFANCYSLASITIPDSINIINTYLLNNCRSIISVTIPDGITSILSYTFTNCYALTNINIPNSLKDINNYAFQNCYSITRVIIPDGVTIISSYAFANCYGMAEYHLKPTTPPTLSSTNAFQGIPSDCVIYVPQGCLEAYKTATNWATYASYMQEEPS